MSRYSRKSMIVLLCCIAATMNTVSLQAYPLDGADASGIRRLHGYAAQQKTAGPKLAKGALLNTSDIRLALLGASFEKDFDQQPKQEQLQKALESIFKTRDPSYSIVVVDISDPAQIAWAAINPDTKQQAGSVGKMITLAGLFNSLAKAFPKIEDRQRVLRDTMVTAGEWVIADEHKVPFYESDTNSNRFAVPMPSDQFTLFEWMDHVASASSNAAGSVVWREAMLLHQFGARYPLTESEANDFFKTSKGSTLQALSLSVSNEPLQAVGIPEKSMRQGSFWTRTGKRKVPGVESYASPRELARYIVRMEQGLLVDEWSSLEIKKLMYMTKRRYRYVYSPELHQSAVYFKSGSLYQCVAEEGYRCAKYAGNKRNLMNSVAVIESLPGADKPYRYIAVLMSNVLKVNSAWDHASLGAAIHKVILTRSTATVESGASAKQMYDAGKSED